MIANTLFPALVAMPFEITCHTVGGVRFVARSNRKPTAEVGQAREYGLIVVNERTT